LGMGLAQVDLAFLAIGDEASAWAPDGDPGRHLAKALVAPVDAELAAGAAVVAQRAVDLVVDILREDTMADDPVDSVGNAGDEVDEVHGVARVVVERAASLGLGRAPCAALRPQD